MTTQDDPIFDPDATISVSEAASLLGLTPQRVRQLAQGGYVAMLSPGKLTPARAAQGYALFLREVASKTTKTAADSRVRDARAAEIELRIAERLRELVPADETQTVIDHIVAAHLEAWAGLPAMITRDVRERARIEAIVKKAQGQIARRTTEASRVLREGGKLP